MNSEKSGPASRYRKLDRMVARMKEILQCIICLEIVGCPAVQCEAGHLMCGQCRDNLRENTCPTCRQPLIAVRNRVVEQVVEVLPKECPNAGSGCQELLEEEEVDAHRVTCSFRQFSCPRPSCPWVGSKPEIIGHMRDIHPQHVLSSNRQAVKVPFVWDEVSSWTMFLNDEILVLKFRLEQATNMLFGSFKCLGLLNPVDSFKYYITVKRGDLETNMSGSIGPERSATSVQCDDDWDCVFPRSRFDDHPESGLSNNDGFILVDVAVEDNRREGVGQMDAEVMMQAQQCEVRDEGGAPSTGQAGGKNQSDQTADRVIHKLGNWVASGFLGSRENRKLKNIHCIITETNTNIINVIQKSVGDIAALVSNDWFYTLLCIENYHLCLSRDFAETEIKMERLRAAGRGYFSEEWMFAYFRVVEQAVTEAFYENIHKLPDIKERELEELVAGRERRLRDESAESMLRWAHRTGGHQRVESIVWLLGGIHKKSHEELCRLSRDAATISWKNMTPTA